LKLHTDAHSVSLGDDAFETAEAIREQHDFPADRCKHGTPQSRAIRGNVDDFSIGFERALGQKDISLETQCHALGRALVADRTTVARIA
jgi:hypothetical protein